MKGGNVRKEESPTVCLRPVLPIHPEMVTADERFCARPEDRVAEVLAQLDRLVHKAIAITQVRALGSTEVDAEAFR